MKLLKPIIFALCAIFALTGCKSSKNAATPSAKEGEHTSVITSGIPRYQPIEERYRQLTSRWKQWKDVEMSVKVNVKSPAKLNAAGKVYMRRGQWISVSVRMLGFEVATLWLDNDSLVAVDKFHKKYVSLPTREFLGNAGVTIDDVQDLLLGRAFLTGKGTATPAEIKQFRLEQADNGWYFIPNRQPDAFSYGFLGSDSDTELSGTIIDIPGHGSVLANYNGTFESRTCGWFAQEVTLENASRKPIEATLRWDLNGARFNTGVAKHCTIPDNCDPITLENLNALLKKF